MQLTCTGVPPAGMVTGGIGVTAPASEDPLMVTWHGVETITAEVPVFDRFTTHVAGLLALAHDTNAALTRAEPAEDPNWP